LDAETLAAAIVIAFLASFSMSATGFGFALTMAPLLTLVWNVREAVAASVLLSFLNQGPLIFEVRTHVVPRRVVALLAGSAAGIPIGLLIFEKLDPDGLKVLVAAVVILASAILFLAPRFEIADRVATPWGVVSGVVSGALGASTSLSGPPVVIYLLGRHPDVETFRATILTYFMPAGVVTVAAFAVLGRITEDVLILAAAAVPAMVAGMLLGMWLRRRLDSERFRSLVLGTLVASSVAVIVTAVA
jgi:uncharacterized membrane protein YfcA